jgi:hypothetical protein
MQLLKNFILVAAGCAVILSFNTGPAYAQDPVDIMQMHIIADGYVTMQWASAHMKRMHILLASSLEDKYGVAVQPASRDIPGFEASLEGEHPKITDDQWGVLEQIKEVQKFLVVNLRLPDDDDDDDGELRVLLITLPDRSIEKIGTVALKVPMDKKKEALMEELAARCVPHIARFLKAHQK